MPIFQDLKDSQRPFLSGGERASLASQFCHSPPGTLLSLQSRSRGEEGRAACGPLGRASCSRSRCCTPAGCGVFTLKDKLSPWCPGAPHGCAGWFLPMSALVVYMNHLSECALPPSSFIYILSLLWWNLHGFFKSEQFLT